MEAKSRLSRLSVLFLGSLSALLQPRVGVAQSYRLTPVDSMTTLVSFNELDCADSLSCVAVITRPGPFGVYTRGTFDGGRTWRDLGEETEGRTWLFDAACSRNGLVLVNDDHSRVFRSIDSGQTWHVSDPQLEVQPFNVDVFDDSLAVLGGDGGISLSSDGGVTWTARLLPPGLRAEVYVNQVRMVTPSKIVGLVPRADSVYAILRTEDAGVTWDVQQFPAIVASACFTSPTNGWVVGTIFEPDGDLVLHTTDGGASWQRAIIGPLPYAYGLAIVSFADSLRGLISGRYGRVLWTVDGGAHWTLIRTPHWLPGRSGLARVQYPVPTMAYIAANDSANIIYRVDFDLTTAAPGAVSRTATTTAVSARAGSVVKISAPIDGAFEPVTCTDVLGRTWQLEATSEQSGIWADMREIRAGIYWVTFGNRVVAVRLW